MLDTTQLNEAEVRYNLIDPQLKIAKWNLAAFIFTIVSVAVLILTSILQNTYSGAVFQEWANSIQMISSALGTLLLSLLGVVGLRRILAASREFLSDDD